MNNELKVGDHVRIAEDLSMIGGKTGTILRDIEGDNGVTVSIDGTGVGWYVRRCNLTAVPVHAEDAAR